MEEITGKESIEDQIEKPVKMVKKPRKTKSDVKIGKKVKNPVQLNPAPRKTIIQAQLDGKLYNKRGVKTLDELLGEKVERYQHKTVEDYKNFLDDLNLTDLQEHATKVGVLPKEDRNVLIKVLIKQYELVTSDYFNVVERQSNFPKKISKNTEKILGEGR